MDKPPKEYAAGELMSATQHGSGSGGKDYYKIELRTTYHEPMVLRCKNGSTFVVDHVWRTLQVGLSLDPWAANIPIRSWDRDGLDHGLVSYVAAEAHRWAFLAALEAHEPLGSSCVQTRLVKVRYNYSFSTEELGVTEPQQEVFRRQPKVTPRFTEPASEDA